MWVLTDGNYKSAAASVSLPPLNNILEKISEEIGNAFASDSEVAAAAVIRGSAASSHAHGDGTTVLARARTTATVAPAVS